VPKVLINPLQGEILVSSVLVVRMLPVSAVLFALSAPQVLTLVMVLLRVLIVLLVLILVQIATLAPPVPKELTLLATLRNVRVVQWVNINLLRGERSVSSAGPGTYPQPPGLSPVMLVLRGKQQMGLARHVLPVKLATMLPRLVL
jgi:hypothetical protein